MKSTERRYNASEAVFFLRVLIGPKFGNLYTTLADQRRGKPTKLPFIKLHVKEYIPYYLSSDLMSFVDAVRSEPRLRLKAKTGVKPVFREVDFDEEMTL